MDKDIDGRTESTQTNRFKLIRSVIAFVLAWSAVVGLVFLGIKFWPHANPVPTNIKSQVNFPIIYPKNATIDLSSWNYQTSNKSLTLTIKQSDYTVALTEQKVPLAYQNDAAAYNRFIGSLKPTANFDVPLGTVSIANFVTSGDYQLVGATGILNAKGTLLLAHPDRKLTDDEWRNLFNALAVD